MAAQRIRFFADLEETSLYQLLVKLIIKNREQLITISYRGRRYGENSLQSRVGYENVEI